MSGSDIATAENDIRDPDDVEAAFEAFAPDDRDALLRLRRILREEAAAAHVPGALEATLKWGQPSYALKPKRGTAVRLGLCKTGEPALFVHCGTTLIADWAATAGPEARVIGNRALIPDPERLDDIRPFIRMALAYRSGT